jgi:hypothetical protein
MSQFILFIDKAGAEFTKARTTRKNVRAMYDWKPITLRPVEIVSLEVIVDSGAAQRAAGGFLLLGPLGAAAGVLLGKGPKVLFELILADGERRRGIVQQRDYATLRKKIEAIQTYRPGQLRKQIAVIVGGLALLSVCIGLGPISAIVLIGSIITFTTIRGSRRKRKESPAQLEVS